MSTELTSKSDESGLTREEYRERMLDALRRLKDLERERAGWRMEARESARLMLADAHPNPTCHVRSRLEGTLDEDRCNPSYCPCWTHRA